MITAGYSTEIIKYIVNTLVSVTCDGEPVSSLFGCVSDGTVCSNRGTCGNHTCNCNTGFGGTFCESAIETSSSNAGTIIGIVIGTQLFSFFLYKRRCITHPLSIYVLHRCGRSSSDHLDSDWRSALHCICKKKKKR